MPRAVRASAMATRVVAPARCACQICGSTALARSWADLTSSAVRAKLAVSHQPTRQREQMMRRLKSPGQFNGFSPPTFRSRSSSAAPPISPMPAIAANVPEPSRLGRGDRRGHGRLKQDGLPILRPRFYKLTVPRSWSWCARGRPPPFLPTACPDRLTSSPACSVAPLEAVATNFETEPLLDQRRTPKVTR